MRNPFKKIDEHAELMNKMASATGTDLSDAALDGRLDAESYRKALKKCTHCKSVGTCLSWLDEHADGSVEEPPEFCANRDVLKQLKPGTG
jgi:hypothetical protein